ncbi:hypothetical protein Tco_1324290 [Tanacetum coccineum]
MDVGAVKVPYLLARYLRLFATGRKNGEHISGGQFVARLAKHFGLLTAKILGGLMVIAPELPIIDMTELPPPPPSTHARTIPKRMSILEEDVHEIRWGLTEQREVIDAMAHDFFRFSTWVNYTPYAQTHVSYQRRIRQRTGEASTSTAQQDPQQPDP